MLKRHSLLLITSAISIGLFIFLLYLQSKESNLLALEKKWLFIVAIPILIGLIAGRYIQKFKGWGIELETRLKNPLGEINLIAADASEHILSGDKSSLTYLNELSLEKKQKLQLLSFISEKKDYYSSDAINKYLSTLTNLKYIEVKRKDGRFICLFPVDFLKMENYRSDSIIRSFIEAIESGKVKSKFKDNAITESVRVDACLLDILPKVRSSRYGFLPVVSKKGILLGIINTRAIEKRIADEVMIAQMRQ